MLEDFKEFLKRGNVLDLAIGVVMGAAFGKIVTTLVEGVLMPVVGMLSGGINFSSQCINLSGGPIESCSQALADGKAVLQVGQFITDVINFVIVAFIVFLIARWAIKLFKGMESDSGPSDEVVLLTEIRDSLKKT